MFPVRLGVAQLDRPLVVLSCAAPARGHALSAASASVKEHIAIKRRRELKIAAMVSSLPVGSLSHQAAALSPLAALSRSGLTHAESGGSTSCVAIEPTTQRHLRSKLPQFTIYTQQCCFLGRTRIVGIGIREKLLPTG